MMKSNEEQSKDETDERPGDLPVRRHQSRQLLQAPKKGAKVVIERGADAYFTFCERVAAFLNRGD